jgi:NADH-quinone oxidoreductase subunit N
VIMNLAAFAVITARERETGLGDDISSLYGLGRDRPWLAWPMTIAMLALAGFPATAGFFGKIYLIDAAADNGYTWLGIVIVLGSAVSLAYYLRVVAAVWMRSPAEAPAPLSSVVARPAIAGGSPEADDEDRAAGREPGTGGVPLSKRDTGAVVESDLARDEEPAEPRLTDARFQPEVVFVAVVCALVTIVFGVFPEPLFDVARDAGEAIQSLV